jgi:hypothetical protein
MEHTPRHKVDPAFAPSCRGTSALIAATSVGARLFVARGLRALGAAVPFGLVSLSVILYCLALIQVSASSWAAVSKVQPERLAPALVTDALHQLAEVPDV